MPIYYLLLGLVCLLSGVRLVFNKLYVNRYGSHLRSALWFTFLSCGFFVVLMLAIGQRLAFSWFSLLMALLFAIINVACTVAGFRTLAIGNVSTYTLVLQLGGLIIPFLYGMLFGGDENVWTKWVCIALIIGALAVNTEWGKKKSSREALLWYGLLFVLNGAACIVLSIHQKDPNPFGAVAVDATAFTLLYMIFTAFFALVIFLILRIKDGKDKSAPPHGLDFAFSAGYGAFYGAGNLLLALCLSHIEPSAQFPIITGGAIVVAGIVGLFFKEKISLRFVIATLLVIGGTLLLLPWAEILK